MSKLAEWVKAARAHAQFTQAQLAEKVHRTKGNVSHWELGKNAPSFDMIQLIAEVTGYPLPNASAQVHETSATVAAVVPGLVPVISWVQAGQWAEAVAVDPREVEQWLPCPVRHSPRTYALHVRGDSMTAPIGQRSYPEGSIVFVDPEKRSPHNGQRIIALRIDSDEATFKVYKNEDGRQWLQPLNPAHPPIFDPFMVLGTVIGMWMPD